VNGVEKITNYFRAFRFLYNSMRRAYWNQEKLAEYQNKRLRSIIKHAYNCVPYYHRKLTELKIEPDEIKIPMDLSKLPILKKEDIRRNLANMISDGLSVDKLEVLSTSGSTGKPLFFYISAAEREFRKAKHLRANISCGQKPFDHWVNITAPHHFGQETRLQRALGLFTPVPISVFDDVDMQISKIEKLKPDVLDGYSSSLLLLAKELRNRGKETIKSKFILGGSELIDNPSRRFIEEVLHSEFYDQYSCVELDRIAWECPERQGYHIDVDDIIVQFVDENGEEVTPGEQGEIICTSLFNYAMPFIKYSVGDVGVLSQESCACGRTLPLMKMLEGRKDSLLILPDGRTLTPRAFTVAMHMFQFYKDIDQFRVTQKKLNAFKFDIKIKAERSNDRALEDLIETELVSHLKSTLRLSIDMDFDVDFVDDIPLDKSGKLMAVVSELKSKV
jgi:phenylacetate-CoA ligase